jgi:uncharacterized protein (UPF0276 family)
MPWSFDDSSRVAVGARWDDARQDERFHAARKSGLVDFVEVNFPISPAENPHDLGLPVLAHTSNNPVASAVGLDPAVVEAVRVGADRADSPWVGEHLSWLGSSKTGALGYVINPIFSSIYVVQAVRNVRRLRRRYNRPIALELGPVYNMTGEFTSELHFLNEVARAADTGIILDITHWMISNRNLQRADDWGLSALDPERVIELHVAGMRPSNGGRFWHDSHGSRLHDDVLVMLGAILRRFSGVRAITFEHSMEGSAEDFLAGLEQVRSVVQ